MGSDSLLLAHDRSFVRSTSVVRPSVHPYEEREKGLLSFLPPCLLKGKKGWRGGGGYGSLACRLRRDPVIGEKRGQIEWREGEEER